MNDDIFSDQKEYNYIHNYLYIIQMKNNDEIYNSKIFYLRIENNIR